MTLESFTGHLKQRLEEATGCEVRIQPTQKNNGITLTSITIMRENRNVAPTTYAEQYFDQFNEGDTIEEILDRIIEIDEKYQLDSNFDISSFTDYNKVKDKLRFKLVNTSKNKERLLQIPHKEFLDLSKIYFAEVDSLDGCSGTITVATEHMKLWGIDSEELDKIATINTFKNNKITLMNLVDFIEEEVLGEELAFEGMDIPDVPMYALTFKSKIFGAAVFACDSLFKKFADFVEDNLYIIPSSIHELLIIPCNSSHQDVTLLKYMIREVNSTQVAEEEILSYNLYFYSREKDEIEII